MYWPGDFPGNLDPSENLWGIVKQQVFCQRTSSITNELKVIIEACWGKSAVSTIKA